MRMIDADEVFPWYVEAFKGKITPDDIRFSMNDIRENLDNIPTAEPKTGRWVRDDPFLKPICSECGEPCMGLHGFDCTLTDYCPHCGAKMEEQA